MPSATPTRYAIPTMQGGIETIAGFTNEEMASLFREALKLGKVCLPEKFVKVLEGTY